MTWLGPPFSLWPTTTLPQVTSSTFRTQISPIIPPPDYLTSSRYRRPFSTFDSVHPIRSVPSSVALETSGTFHLGRDTPTSGRDVLGEHESDNLLMGSGSFIVVTKSIPSQTPRLRSKRHTNVDQAADHQSFYSGEDPAVHMDELTSRSGSFATSLRPLQSVLPRASTFPENSKSNATILTNNSSPNPHALLHSNSFHGGLFSANRNLTVITIRDPVSGEHRNISYWVNNLGDAIYDDDIFFGPEESLLKLQVTSKTPSKRWYGLKPSLGWPNATIYYKYATQEVKDFSRLHSMAAISDWTMIAPYLTFVELPISKARESHGERVITITNLPNASYSTVGMRSWPWYPTTLNFDWSLDKTTSLHEWGHQLGLGHEHDRPDRDKFVNFNCEALRCSLSCSIYINCCRESSSCCSCLPYRPKGPWQYNFQYMEGEYDVWSIMHYEGGVLSKPGQHVYTKVSDGKPIPANSEISFGDMFGVCKIYIDQCSSHFGVAKDNRPQLKEILWARYKQIRGPFATGYGTISSGTEGSSTDSGTGINEETTNTTSSGAGSSTVSSRSSSTQWTQTLTSTAPLSELSSIYAFTAIPTAEPSSTTTDPSRPTITNSPKPSADPKDIGRLVGGKSCCNSDIMDRAYTMKYFLCSWSLMSEAIFPAFSSMMEDKACEVAVEEVEN